MAERAGFEPAVAHHHTAFRERHHQPLGHLSIAECSKAPQPLATASANSCETKGRGGFTGEWVAEMTVFSPTRSEVGVVNLSQAVFERSGARSGLIVSRSCAEPNRGGRSLWAIDLDQRCGP